jgi:RNA polymerase sporulation-specific sigma factor
MGRMSAPQKQENDKIVVHVNLFRETGDQAAFAEIVRALDGYLQHLPKKFFYVPGHNDDDVCQEALYALATKAIPDYDEEKGPFLGFAKLCIKRHIITCLKSANNNKNKSLNSSLSLDATICDEEDGPVSASAFVPSKDADMVETLVQSESHSRMKGILFEVLTPLEGHVLELYLKNMSYVDIVEIMNKTRRGRNRVDCKVIDNALCRIKKKAVELEAAMKRGEPVQVPFSDG